MNSETIDYPRFNSETRQPFIITDEKMLVIIKLRNNQLVCNNPSQITQLDVGLLYQILT